MGDSVSLDRYRELLPAVQQALVACGCNSLSPTSIGKFNIRMTGPKSKFIPN
jgi:hypothetical protein